MIEWTWTNKCIAFSGVFLTVWFLISLASTVLIQNATSIASLVLASCSILVVVSYLLSQCCKKTCCQPEEIIYRV